MGTRVGPIDWESTGGIGARDFVCGHCGRDVTSQIGFYGADTRGGQVRVYLCHRCGSPTFIDREGHQVPGPMAGEQLQKLPADICGLYDEARRASAANSPTLVVLACRKLLMHLAVEEGAKEGETYESYVNFIVDNGLVPKKAKAHVDHIRKIGNVANHRIVLNSTKDAADLLLFCSMIMRFAYELPGLLDERTGAGGTPSP